MRVPAPSLAFGALCLSSVPFASALAPSDIPADTPVSQLIARANAHLAQGNGQDALTYYDLAIQKDTSNYLTIFKRGAVYLSLGKSQQAGRDFDQVLAIKPGFEGALTQRAKIRSRNADWKGSREDFAAAGKQDSQDWRDLDEAEAAELLSVEAEKKEDWEACVTQAGTAILVAGTAPELRQRRARCRFEKGEVVEGIADLSHVVQINPSAVEAHLQISAATFYSLGKIEQGTLAVAKCLQNDPDNKACSKLRKSEKAIERTLKKVSALKDKRQYSSAVKLLVPQGKEELGLLQVIKDDFQTFREAGYIHPKAENGLYAAMVEAICEAYIEMNNLKKAAKYCDETLTYNPTSLPALMSKARRQIEAEEFEAAINTLNSVKEEHGNTQKTQELLQEAHTRLKQSKTKDYYKVLDVPRDASEDEIKHAYRKGALKYHPDKAAAKGIPREEAQKKITAIIEAYEVLSDPTLRERFDRGDDPNDPQSGQMPFEGSPFGYEPGGKPVFMRSQGSGGFSSHQFVFQGGFPQGFPFG